MQLSFRHALQAVLLVSIVLVGTGPSFAFDSFRGWKDYCWAFEVAGDESETGILKLRFRSMGQGNYLASGTLIEDGEPFAIHGNAITVGSEVHMNTVVSGFVEAEGNVFLGNGIVTTILDRGTKDGIFRGMEQGIDRNTSTSSTGYFEGTATFIGRGKKCNQ